MKHERSSNFELLRLLCIFGILVMHTFAGIDTAASPGNMLANVFANSLFNTGVTCFILLSGYFGIRFDLKKLIGLDLVVIFFTVLGTVALGDFGSQGSDQVLHSGLVETLLVHHLLLCSVHPGTVSQSGG